jgi:hypothetical protein
VRSVAVDADIFGMAAEQAALLPVPRSIKETPLDMLSRVWKGIFDPFGIKQVFTTISSQLAVASAGPPDKGVQVISEQDVADYHATVLSADDSSSLEDWLKTNGYAWNDQASAWLQPYIASHWKITAFRLLKSPGQNGDGIQSRAIRMSFTTDRPFYPYSEPQATPQGNAATAGGRLLNVAFLSDKRVTGKLADGKPWPGRLQYAGGFSGEFPPSQFLVEAKFDQSKEATPSPSYLTYFVDESNPRPGTADLYFSTDADQTPFRQTYVDPDLPPVYVMDWSNLFADFVAVVIVGLPVVLLGFVLLRGRRRA